MEDNVLSLIPAHVLKDGLVSVALKVIIFPLKSALLLDKFIMWHVTRCN